MTTGPPRVPRARRDADCLLARRYTSKVQKEMELDEKALANLQADRQRFLCKAVENYVQCLEQGEEHDTWVFRLASLWLENGGVAAVNATMKVSEGHTPPGGQDVFKHLCSSPERGEEDPLPQVPAPHVPASCSYGDTDGVRGQRLPGCPPQRKGWTLFLQNKNRAAAPPVFCPPS